MDNGKPGQQPGSSFTLITPSASPPASRSQPHRYPDQASPTKRPRLSSTPRRTQQHDPSSSSSDNIDAIDFHKAREESTMRLLDVWAGLAERYARPIDEDDIIDIMTGKVVKDRGVLRGSKTWAVGAFADAAEDAEDELEEDDDEVDIDELDSIANAGVDDIDLKGVVTGVPPVMETDARDAEDLRDFMEAEQRRREVYGSEVDETEGSLYESQGDEALTEQSRHSEPIEDTPFDATTSGTWDEQASSDVIEQVYVDSGSDDELDNWDLGEASIVYRLPKTPKTEDSDSEVEPIVSFAQVGSISPEIPLSWSSAKSSRSERERVPTQRQLQTPPQSHTSSSIPSTIPDDYLAEYSDDASLEPQPQSSSPLSSRRDSFNTKLCQVAIAPKKGGLTPKVNLTNSVPHIRRLDLARVTPKRPKKLSSDTRTSTSRTYGTTSTGSTSTVRGKNLSRQSPLAAQVQRGESQLRTAQVEVLIERQTPFQTIKVTKVRPHAKKGDVRHQITPERKTSTTVKGKGKQRATSLDERIESENFDLNELTNNPSSPLVSSKHFSSPSRNQSRGTPRPIPTSSYIQKPSPDNANKMNEKLKYVPLEVGSALTAGRKRKRVVSDFGADLNEEQLPVIREAKPRSRSASAPRRSHRSSDNESLDNDRIRGPGVRPKGKLPSNPKSPTRMSDYSSDNASSPEEPHTQRDFSHAPSHFEEQSYYPYPQHSYPHHPHGHQPVYAPIPDPRAQLIITQAMQQLSALVGGAWPCPTLPRARSSTPFTPSHHRTKTSSSVYSTPTHHPHPYPHAYDPSFSSATLPPDSPEVRSSSPPVASRSGGGPRQKSLVRRSQSKGRRVSFILEDDTSDVVEVPSSPDIRTKGNGRHGSQNRNNHSVPGGRTTDMQQKRKKEKARARPETDGSSSSPEAVPSRGRPVMRSQTPGPPTHVRIHDLSSSSKTAVKQAKSSSGAGHSKSLQR